MLRYTVAIASLTYLKAMHPGLARGVHQHRPSDSETGVYTPAKAVKQNQQRIWCWLIWIIVAFTILSFMCGNLRAIPADMFFGTMVIVLVLVCISLAILFTSPSPNSRQRSFDNGSQSPVSDQQNESTLHQLSNSSSPTTDANRCPHDVANRHPVQSPVTSVHNLSEAPSFDGSTEIDRNDVSSEELQAMRRVEAPPPYDIAFSLPMPGVHSNVLREPQETPPPPYDTVLRGNVV